VNNSATLDLTTGMTLEAWVRPASINADYQSIITKPMDSTFNQISYVLHGGSRPTGTPSLGLSVSASNLTGPATLPLNAWSHVAGTYDGVTVRLYVNGVQVASQAQNGAVLTSAESVRIGLGWSGLIDDVRIYNRALAASEIQADMNTPIVLSGRPVAPVNVRIVAQ
jgi:hypothetical protein